MLHYSVNTLTQCSHTTLAGLPPLNLVHILLLKCHTRMGNHIALLSHVTIYLYVKGDQIVLSRKQWANQLETSTLYCKAGNNKKASLVSRAVAHYQLRAVLYFYFG